MAHCYYSINSFASPSTDILKHTEKTSPDHAALEQALDKIKSVMTFINDDKRKTEAKLKLFEIHNDIEMCPVSLNSFIYPKNGI